MFTFREFLLERDGCPIYNNIQLKDLEKFADGLLNKYNIDIEFTKHFNERMSDDRNNPCISIEELEDFFKKVYREHGKRLKDIKDGDSAILVDVQKSLNLPFVVKIKNDEIVVILKTIMRKRDFKSTNKKIKY